MQKQSDPEPTEFTGNTTTSLSYARKEYIGVWLDTALGRSVPQVHGLSSSFSPPHTGPGKSPHYGLTSVASAVAPAPAPPFTLWQPELLPLGTPNPDLRGSPCLLQR